ncbi:MAG: restriction endonuclease subunit S [Ignavibacteriales bacterium]|nr:restriction endonuclease subunit S [Ignavibacteriales bacterium]
MNYELKKYPKYKPSGIEWIGEIPEHWEVKKLRFIGNFSSSGIDKKINEDEPLVKIINYTDVYGNSSRILDSKRNYMEVSCSEVKRIEHKVSKGDLIFTPSSETIEDIGLSALVDEDLENTAFSYHVLRFRFEKEVCHSFKKYLCNNNLVLSYFSANARGTTRQTLSRDNFNSAIVILPPNEEQTAIANFLDEKTAKIDLLIEKKKKLIELYKEEKTALINQAVTRGINPNVKLKPSGVDWLGDIPEHWEVKKLKYVARVQSSNVDKKTNEDEKPVLLCNYIDVYKNEFIDHSINFMEATAKEKEIEKFILKQDDVLITKDSETPDDIANPAYVTKDFENVICGYHLAQIRANNKELSGKFLFRLFQSKRFNSHFEVSANGVTRFGLPLDSITDVKITFPSLIEQQQIVEYIESETKRIDDKIARAEKEIELLQEYRTALISEVVTGKIKV